MHPELELSLPVRWPVHRARKGHFVSLEPLDPLRHGPALFAHGHQGAEAAAIWDYMPYGPFADLMTMQGWLLQAASAPDPQFYAVIDKASGEASGMVSLLRITPSMGSIEVGHIWYAPSLQRTAGPTEAMFLLFAHVFDELGYRRLEWKCNDRNERSKRAALRLGFSFEGVFRQHLVIKGRNRDSAWFSMLDHEWPLVRSAMRLWLAGDNLNESGTQEQPLSHFLKRERAGG